MTPAEVKDLRQALGWTQQRLADHLGLRHRSQVRHLESGRTPVTGPVLRLLEQLQQREKKDKPA